MSKAQHYLFYSCTIVIVLLFLEGASFFAVAFLKGKGVFYSPAVYESYDEYLLIRDEILGWPSPKLFGENGIYDSTGSRITPAFPNASNAKNCISLYGDSFTWSAEVDDDYAWGNVFSKLAGCRVANFGVGGYGSDQAFLRFDRQRDDNSKIVFLNHLSENILRNVNQYRDLLYPVGGVGFKPRFIVDEEDSLSLIPIPTFSAEQYKDVVYRPSLYLTNEFFLPGGETGVSIDGFPYTFSVLKALNHFHVKANLLGKPWFHDFYQKDHASQGLAVTTKILASFNEEAAKRGKIPVVTIIPTGKDLLYFEENDLWVYQSLIDELSARGIDVLNFGDRILRRLHGKDPCSLFDDCAGHFNEAGYEMLAMIAYEHLQMLGVLQETGVRGGSSTVNKP